MVTALCLAGCGAPASSGKGDDDSSSAFTQYTADDNITDDMTEPIPTSLDGEYIMKAYKLLKSDSYSLRLTYTDPDGFNTSVYRVVDGGNYHEMRKNSLGESGSICVGENSYDYDKLCGIYRRRTSGRPESLIESVIDQALPATDINKDPNESAKYAVEEYTYTGDTYITVMDFYFDKVTGLPVKYTTRYVVEEENGDEGMTEIRTINEIIAEDSDSTVTDGETAEIDRSVFDTSFVDKLTDFDRLGSEQKLSYCRTLFARVGVTQEQLDELDIDDDRIKGISYDELTALVYNCCTTDISEDETR
jgi:hypothetical protein